jgi:hypothetical protein
MMDVLPWATLIVCFTITVARVPGAIRGNNRSLCLIFALITLAILLSIDAPYLAIDAVLGGYNVTNLILRFLLYAAFFIVGIKSARAFGSGLGELAVRGPVGLTVLASVSVFTVWCFLATETAGSSTGLRDLAPATSLDVYAALGRLYPAYVSVCLIPGSWRTVIARGPGTLRLAAAFLTAGLFLLVLSQGFPLIPSSLGWLLPLINYSAALLIALGLAGFGVSKALARRRPAEYRGLAASVGQASAGQSYGGKKSS